MTIQELVQKMIDAFTITIADAEKFDNGNKSAGVRVRKAMKLLKFQANVVRERVTFDQKR
jgi:hypothetical protein